LRSLEGKSAIITGAGQGIGREYAHRFAAEGAKVAIAELNEENGRKVVDEITTTGAEAISVRTDVSDESSTKQMAEEVASKFGKIDILLNNAAIYYGLQHKTILDIPVEEWDRVMAVNSRGPFLCAKAVVPYMKKLGKGKIVNQSSSVVQVGSPNLLHYVTSKGGLIAFTRALARELGKFNINVNAIAPGFVLSEAGQLRGAEFAKTAASTRSLVRDIYPKDIVGTAVFLCSDDSDSITGQTIVVDGGNVFI
jgi:NAD(P)-dependent dehydrogenase (short-subunit alcohol dehydrogenase family)